MKKTAPTEVGGRTIEGAQDAKKEMLVKTGVRRFVTCSEQ
jgi:hypothetical protein